MRVIFLVGTALLLSGCAIPGDDAATRSQSTGQYQADTFAVVKPTAFGLFYTYVSHEAWPNGYTQYFPGTSQDTRYPGQCGPVPFNPNQGDRFKRDGTVVPC